MQIMNNRLFGGSGRLRVSFQFCCSVRVLPCGRVKWGQEWKVLRQWRRNSQHSLSLPHVQISQKFSLCYHPFDNQEHICIQNFDSSVISSVLHSPSPQISKLPSSTTSTLTLIQMQTVFSSTVIYSHLSKCITKGQITTDAEVEQAQFVYFFPPLLALSQCVWNLSPPNPLQDSCLENPMDRGAWRATAHGVARVGHHLVTKWQDDQGLNPWPLKWKALKWSLNH